MVGYVQHLLLPTTMKKIQIKRFNSFGLTDMPQCDVTPAHCDPANCIKQFSGAGSSCAVR